MNDHEHGATHFLQPTFIETVLVTSCIIYYTLPWYSWNSKEFI